MRTMNPIEDVIAAYESAITSGGVELTDEVLERLVAEAVQGYGVGAAELTDQVHPLQEGPVPGVPCAKCGACALRIEFRLTAKPIGSFSLAGQTDKRSAYRHPWMVCGSCKAECKGKLAHG